MTNTEKLQIIEAPAVAYWSGCGGVEIKTIEYGINDHVVFVVGAWSAKKTAHKARIYYTVNERAYFRYHNYTIHFDDCIRV